MSTFPNRQNLPAPLSPESTPMQVAQCIELTTDQRRTILTEWYADALDLERAADEGMVGEGRSQSAEVRAALEVLDAAWEEENRLV
ncbi:MAG: hypothetical protein R3F49_10330 [Planctomycetota bacterium]